MRLLLLLMIALAIVAPARAEKPFIVETQSPVIAFGDVHGAYDELVSLLQELKVIDDSTDWTGADTHLVSLGDLIDRGADSRAVVELLMKLEQQAAEAGGGVHVILGNHEVMVMSGDLRYVSAAEYAAFADGESSDERMALLDVYRETQTDLSEEEVRNQFERFYPPGYLGLQRAYASDGKIGAWLLEQPVVLRVNDTLYAHGGMSSSVAEQSLEEINSNAKRELRNYLTRVESLRNSGKLSPLVGFWDRRAYLNVRAQAALAEQPKERPAWFDDFAALAELEDAFLFSGQSPVWYRGTAYCHPYAESFNTERVLKRNNARQLVVGHTPWPAGAVQRMDGLVIRLDTGMLKSVYKGRATALVQRGGEQYIHYLGQSGKAQPMVQSRSISEELWSMDDQAMEELLLNGEIVSSEFIGTGITKPKRLSLRRGELSTDAVFKYEDSSPGLESKSRYVSRKENDSDRFQYDVAAYKLDRMIDLEMVPVSVLRTVDGELGGVGAWIPKAINERDRLEQEVDFSGYCLQEEQYRLRFLFDILVYNEDRNLTNIVWTKKDFTLRFIDHSLAFRSTEKRPKQYRKVVLRLSDLFRKQLETLDAQSLAAELSPYLHRRQIEGILARRDLIIEEAKTTDPE